MNNPQTYDPQKVSVIVGTQIFTNFEKGTFAQFEFDEAHFSKKVGIGGNVIRSKNGNYTGKFRFTLMQGAPENDYLSGLAALDRANGAGVIPIMVRDQNGTTLMSTGAAWVEKTPTAGFADEATAREWVLDTTQAYVLLGGLS